MVTESSPESPKKTPRKRNAPPEILGAYVKPERIGKGAMGEIWLCEDPSLLRKVIVKQMQTSLRGNKDLIERFQRECVLLAHLNHPNIVHAYGVWQEKPSGKLSLAMEYISGKDLRNILDTCPTPPVWVVLYILHELLQALVCVHKHNIIHRDLKPGNMMVEKNGRVRLLDFGIARNANHGQDMTMEGHVLGTAAYMSPEQINARKVTPVSDLFSLGIIACEMLMGKNPFRGESFELTSQCILNIRIQTKHFPLSTPRALRKWVCKMVEKKPSKRYQSAQDAADALAKIMEGYPRQLDFFAARWLRSLYRQEVESPAPVSQKSVCLKVGLGAGFALGCALGLFIMHLIAG